MRKMRAKGVFVFLTELTDYQASGAIWRVRSTDFTKISKKDIRAKALVGTEKYDMNNPASDWLVF